MSGMRREEGWEGKRTLSNFQDQEKHPIASICKVILTSKKKLQQIWKDVLETKTINAINLSFKAVI